jgi:hypothetical protein
VRRRNRRAESAGWIGEGGELAVGAGRLDADRIVNDSGHELRDEAARCGEQAAELTNAPDQLPESPLLGLDDLAPAAAERIRQFMGESTVRGGASPADVADLYTSQEIVDDDEATAYLDRRFVHGEVLQDWRELQDRLSFAYLDSMPGTSAETLLANIDLLEARQQSARSIFDDPDEDELIEELQTIRLDDRDPLLSDLTEAARQAIERYIISDVLCYGLAPYKVMELREGLRTDGDDRALQYLDLPFELGDRPTDWDQLRDRALMVRARLERRGVDSGEAYSQIDVGNPNVQAADLLSLLDQYDPRR